MGRGIAAHKRSAVDALWAEMNAEDALATVGAAGGGASSKKGKGDKKRKEKEKKANKKASKVRRARRFAVRSGILLQFFLGVAMVERACLSGPVQLLAHPATSVPAARPCQPQEPPPPYLRPLARSGGLSDALKTCLPSPRSKDLNTTERSKDSFLVSRSMVTRVTTHQGERGSDRCAKPDKCGIFPPCRILSISSFLSNLSAKNSVAGARFPRPPSRPRRADCPPAVAIRVEPTRCSRRRCSRCAGSRPPQVLAGIFGKQAASSIVSGAMKSGAKKRKAPDPTAGNVEASRAKLLAASRTVEVSEVKKYAGKEIL